MKQGNLFAEIDSSSTEESFETLVKAGKIRVERIVSTGQSSPEGDWYDQDEAEWVMVVSGAAVLRFQESPNDLEVGPSDVEMRPGDWVNIPPHCKHRVESTSKQTPTVWLAVFYND